MLSTNCLGEKITYRVGENSERLYPGYDPKLATVLLLGGSYTSGLEEQETESLSALLLKNNGIMSINLGRNGYDSMQALEYGKYYRDRFPNAKMVILNIMYENLNHLVASYWPAYTVHPYIHALEFKSSVRGSVYHKVDPAIFDSKQNIINAVEKALREDYWARPDPSFPYSLALLRAVTANSFPDIMRMYKGRRENAEYRYQYQDEALSENLRYVLREYASWAEREKLVPLVFFVPRSGGDITSGGEWIERNRDKLPEQLVMRNMDFTDVDPRRYNLKPNGDCHPSAYGIAAMARQYASLITEHMPKNPEPK